VARLHGSSDDVPDLALQGVEVDVVAETRSEGVHRLHGVVAGAVEAPVDDVLHATAHGTEELEHRYANLLADALRRGSMATTSVTRAMSQDGTCRAPASEGGTIARST